MSSRNGAEPEVTDPEASVSSHVRDAGADAGEPDVRSAAEARVGQVFAEYRLQELLGVGGTAAVYRALDVEEQPFALKVLHASLGGDGRVRKRFLREAQIAKCREDIPLVAHHLLRRIAAKEAGLRARFFIERGGLLYPRLSPGLVRALLRRSYPTNVRELEGLLWEALAESPGERLEAPAREVAVPLGLSAPRAASSGGIETAMDDADRVSGVPEDRSGAPGREEGPDGPSPAAIQSCLDAHNGVIEDAWRPLGLSSRHALARLLKKHGIEIRRRPR